ncbi:MAG: hypothetical protein C0582_01590 [Alphaproteobacteria bacterium]|mgnify:CR=1 FL=1|nr:MAG: hypothetical protein C0582_01590 [Alphaproteobacteria bacterium]
MSSNPYLSILHRNLPRLLGQVNRDQTDPYHGCADRQFWAWKLIDFPNATHHKPVCMDWPYYVLINMLPNDLSSDSCLQLVLDMIAVIPKLSDRHGGLAEALPYEGSFCVTALVLSNVLAALSLIESDLLDDNKQNILSICSTMATFLKKQDEHHGMISNHLATAALAMHLWYHRTGDQKSKQRRDMWLARIRRHADLSEGWMSEYGGADPGYQSWALTELVQLDREGISCGDLIKSGYQFLSYFAMPDGSFANGVGTRLTRFLFPGGVEMAVVPLADFARKNIQQSKFVSLDSIDASNFAPFFNDLALAAVHKKVGEKGELPHETMAIGEIKIFEKAGLLSYRGINTYRVLSIERCDDYVGTDSKRIYAAVNGFIGIVDRNHITLQGNIVPVKRMMPTALYFMVLRLLSISIFQFPALGNKIKIFLAHLLIKSKPKPVGSLTCHIDLETGERTDETKGVQLKHLLNKKGFSPTHMASQGYWQRGDTK